VSELGNWGLSSQVRSLHALGVGRGRGRCLNISKALLERADGCFFFFFCVAFALRCISGVSCCVVLSLVSSSVEFNVLQSSLSGVVRSCSVSGSRGFVCCLC